MPSLDITGLREAVGPRNLNHNRGRLDLPPDFPEGKYACKWVKKGANIQKAKQSDFIQVEGKGYTVDGWEVYQNLKTKQAHIRVLSDGQYVLMVRPMLLQQTLQRLNGNKSRSRMEQEMRGHTIAGEPVTDTGMLPHEVLSKVPGLGTEQMEPAKVAYNQLVSETTGAETVRVSTKTKIKKH